MRKTVLGATAVGITAMLALSACSSSKSTTSSTPSNTSPSSGTSSTTSGAVDGKGAKVGIILPDTQSSNRWVQADPVALKAACTKYNVTCDIQNGNGDPKQQKTEAEQMEANGIKVLLFVNLDSGSGATIEQEAVKNGVTVIDYDRLTPGGGAAIYVSFDNTKVGELQGTTLTQCPQVAGKSAVKYVQIDGAPTDNNATLFKNGYESVLSKTAGWTLEGDQTGEWKPDVASTVFNTFIQKTPDLTAVMVANDGMAGAVITDLTNLHLNGKVAVSGQDATPAGLQSIMTGDQCFSIYKPSTQEADPAIKAAAQLATGQTPATTQTVMDPQTKKDVPSLLATPIAITKANVATPINDGYTAKSQTCTGKYAALCTAAGVK